MPAVQGHKLKYRSKFIQAKQTELTTTQTISANKNYEQLNTLTA